MFFKSNILLSLCFNLKIRLGQAGMIDCLFVKYLNIERSSLVLLFYWSYCRGVWGIYSKIIIINKDNNIYPASSES
jgi:hypothetical protein